MTDNALLDAALAWRSVGCSVVPARGDGSKAPVISWARYQTELPTPEQVTTWMSNGSHGFGLICGQISGNLEMLELEGRAVHEGVYKDLRELAENSGLADLFGRVVGGYSELTPSGGVHLIYRVDAPVAGNTKLARRPATPQELETEPDTKIKGLIETRGEGGFTVVAPSAGPVHPTGAPWRTIAGSPTTVPLLTADERDALHALARAFDQLPRPEPATTFAQPKPTSTGGVSPGDDYNTRADWADLLTAHGWTYVTTGRDGERYWRRPGKHVGVSATTGYGDRGDWLYVFTTSTEFEPEQTYTKFAARALLEHGGDYTACARALAADGYGSEPALTINPAPSNAPATSQTEATTTVAITAAPHAGLTDVGNADLLVATYGNRIRYVPERGQWLRWGGTHWATDDAGQIVEYAKATVLAIDSDDKQLAAHRKRSLSRRSIEAMIALARSHPAVVTPAALLDADPYALCTPDGVVNLLDGTISTAEPDDLHTRATTVPATKMRTPRWDTFLRDTFGDDTDLTAFVQRLAGYSATGVVTHHVLPFLHGSGQNGKSVLLEVFRRVLGDYATTAPAGFLMAGQTQHETEIARLSGHRFVICSEVNPQDRFDEAKVKDLTGGDALTARFMRQDHFTFVPTHHLWLMGNHQPRVTAGGDSFWRRLRFIEFRHRVPDDKKIDGLAQQLVDAEGPGILAWIVDGARVALANGLRAPASVMAATQTYAAEEDALARFVTDRCLLAPAWRVDTTELRKAYEAWCHDEGEAALSAQMLGRELRNRYPIGQVKSNGRRLYTGIALATADDAPDEPDHWSNR